MKMELVREEGACQGQVFGQCISLSSPTLPLSGRNMPPAPSSCPSPGEGDKAGRQAPGELLRLLFRRGSPCQLL